MTKRRLTNEDRHDGTGGRLEGHCLTIWRHCIERRFVQPSESRLANRQTEAPATIDWLVEQIHTAGDEPFAVLRLLERREREPPSLELNPSESLRNAQGRAQRSSLEW